MGYEDGAGVKDLFLAIKVATENVRDSITYTFIMKEMRALAQRGLEVSFYTDAFIGEQVVDGVRCFGRRRGWRARLQTVLFVLRHPSFFSAATVT